MLPGYEGLFRYAGIYVPTEASQFDELSGKNGDQYMHGLENEVEIKDSELRFAFAVYIHIYGNNFQLRQKGVLLLGVASLSGLSVYEHSLKYKVCCRLMILKYVRKTIFKIK